MRGFRPKYQLHDDIQFADYTTRELQDRVSPQQVLEILREGNRRFRTGNRLSRDFGRQVDATAGGETPLAAVLSGIDSRVPAELVLDLGIGDILSIRIAGNVIGSTALGGVEYAVGVAGVKLLLVLGHTRCGAVTSSVQLLSDKKNVQQETGCDHLDTIVNEIARCVEPHELQRYRDMEQADKDSFVDEISKRNVLKTVQAIQDQSNAVRRAVAEGRLMVIGAMYDVKSGNIEFFADAIAPQPA